jgi:hypothetical protein
MRSGYEWTQLSLPLVDLREYRRIFHRFTGVKKSVLSGRFAAMMPWHTQIQLHCFFSQYYLFVYSDGSESSTLKNIRGKPSLSRLCPVCKADPLRFSLMLCTNPAMSGLTPAPSPSDPEARIFAQQLDRKVRFVILIAPHAHSVSLKQTLTVAAPLLRDHIENTLRSIPSTSSAP